MNVPICRENQSLYNRMWKRALDRELNQSSGLLQSNLLIVGVGDVKHKNTTDGGGSSVKQKQPLHLGYQTNVATALTRSRAPTTVRILFSGLM